MEVHLFIGDGHVGVTTLADGGNLPEDHGPWEHMKPISMERGETPRIGINTDKALDGIETHGYYVARFRIG